MLTASARVALLLTGVLLACAVVCLQNGLAEVVSKSRKQIKERKNRTKSLRGVKKNSGEGQQCGHAGRAACAVAVAIECMDASAWLTVSLALHEKHINL